MNVNFQRKVDRILGVFICRLLSIFSRRAKAGEPAGERHRILIILLSEMGSLVLAHPMFCRIKEKYPGAEIYALLFKKNREMLDLLEVIPAENILTINDKSFFNLAADSIKVLRCMQKTKFDTVIDCELFARISSIFSWFTGASIRVGFHPHTMEGLYRGSFINRPVFYNPYRSITEQFLGLVEAVDSNAHPKNKFLPSEIPKKAPPANIRDTEIEEMKIRLYRDFPEISGKKLILIYPGGGILPIRAWPLEYFCTLAEGLIREGYALGIIGMKEDKALAATILSHCKTPSCVDLTGYTRTVRELVVLFHIAPLLITNDGGPGQFAAITPIKTILFYGPETPVLYGPLSSDAYIFYEGLSCSPCLTAYNHRNSPCDGDNLCLKSIKPDRVLERALQILSNS